MSFLKPAIVAFIIYIILDIIWIGFIASGFYQTHLASIARIKDGNFEIIYWAGAAVYILMALGLSLYILQPTPASASYIELFLKGALYGFIAYGIYDMTNLATLKDWSITIAAVDMTWGAFLCGTTACLTRLTLKFI